MKEEFIISKKGNVKITYTAFTLCNCLRQSIKNYLKNENNLTKNINPEVRDNILAGSINYIGIETCCDICVNPKELHIEGINDEFIFSKNIMEVIEKFYAEYVFEENKHSKNIIEILLVVTDFLNYISKISNYAKIITTKKLFEIYKKQKHQNELSQLKHFIESTDTYRSRLINGEDINSILMDIKDKHQISYDSEDGVYHYNDKMQRKAGATIVPTWKAKEIDADICGLSYAYAKINGNELSQIKEIDKNILEMKRK